MNYTGREFSHGGGRVLDPRIVAAWAGTLVDLGRRGNRRVSGDLFSESLTVTHGVLLFVSGMVVAATALGSRAGVYSALALRSGRSS